MSQDARARIMGGGTPPAAPSEGGCGGADPPGNPITLALPRPEHQRAPNVYVDIPFQHKVVPGRREDHLHHPDLLPQGGSSSSSRLPPHDLPLVHGLPQRTSLHRHHSSKVATGPAAPHEVTTLQKQKQQQQSRGASTPPVVSQQPPSLSFTKGAPEEDSIICGRCGRCRCEACSVPRPPAGAWVCGGKCHVSPSAAVDYLSCLCCVKVVLYHCGKDADEDASSSVVDRPCSCSGSDRCLRWACLALAALPLPCLFCYWPLRGVRALFEKTYERFTTQGCRCRPSPSPAPPRRLDPLPPPPTEKRLLHDCA